MGSQPTFSLRVALLVSILASVIAGCSTVNEGGGTAAAPTTSVQTLEYYPYQVKGYQNSYPRKTIQILMPVDARAIFERVRGRSVLVVGDVMLDEWIWGTVSRISPEAPVPVVAVDDHSFTLGGAGNVAANLAALGATVLPFGVVGEDEQRG